MQKLMKFESFQLTEEIQQKQALADTLINKILYSKRLLQDHVEALQLYIEHEAISIQKEDAVSNWYKKFPKKEIFSTRNTCFLISSTLVEYFITPKYLRPVLIPIVLVTGGFSALYVLKNAFVCHNKFIERNLTQLIQNIHNFGNCIRRNMTYFQELFFLRQQEIIESSQTERAWDCITAIKEVTEILYEATRKLERDHKLPLKCCEYYAPMEELRDCEYFKNSVTDYNPKQIKDFHNIFAYVQSQFLLRLALAISITTSTTKLNVELLKMDSLIHQLVCEEENHFQNLVKQLNKKKQMEKGEFNTAKIMQKCSDPKAVFQNSSLKLSACMVAVAGECQALDITLQRLFNKGEANRTNNGEELHAVAKNMHAIENAFSTCFDDFQRLILVYNKFLNSKLVTDHCSKKEDCSVSSSSNFSESILRVEISSSDSQSSDDFYAYIYDEHDEPNEENRQQPKLTQQMELLNFEKNITKKKFQPVLKQLKDRINPIRQIMLEKEREVLSSKGINIDQLDDEENEIVNTLPLLYKKKSKNEGEDPGGIKDSLNFINKDLRLNNICKDKDKFLNPRYFLAQKSELNLLKLETNPILRNVTGKEELLESEC